MTTRLDSIFQQHNFVDNTIYDAICIIVGDEVPWDIAVIGGVRDMILDWLDDVGIAEPDDIYPTVSIER